MKNRAWPSWKPIVSANLQRVRADADAAAIARGFAVDGKSISEGNADELKHYQPAYNRVTASCTKAESYIRLGSPIDWFFGSLANAAFRGYHTADVQLVDLLTDDQVQGKVPEVLSLAKAYLRADDPQRLAFENRWAPTASTGTDQTQPAPSSTTVTPTPAQPGGRFTRRAKSRSPEPAQGTGPEPATQPAPNPAGAAAPTSAPPVTASVVTATDRAQFAATLSTIYLFLDLAQLRVRQFRSVLLGTTLVLVALLIGLASYGFVAPNAIAVCGPGPTTNVTAPSSPTPSPSPTSPAAGISPSTSSSASAQPFSSPTAGTTTTVVTPAQVCASGKSLPAGGDVMLVELFGVAGGAMAAAIALSGLGAGLAGTRYSLSVSQAALKVALGGVFGILGIIFLRAGFVGVLQLNSQAQILAYAVIFGYSQQLLTRLIDKQASTLTSDASPTTPAPAASTASNS